MKLGWYAQRLRAMSVGEVAHRVYRTARYPLDRARMQLGLYARVPSELRDWRGPKRFYFDDSRAPSAAVLEYVERVLDGKRSVLGLGWIDVPRDAWHLEPSRGVEWPRMPAARVLRSAEGLDARLTWELNRGHEWVILARVGDARCNAELFAQLASWREHNPIGIGINWASPMEAAIRIHTLAWVAGFLRGEPLGEIAAMIYTHAAFVRRNLSHHSSANNHLLVELSALAVAERVLWDRPNVDALDELGRELQRQTYPDGVNAEMATHYHEFVLEAVRLVLALEPRDDLKDIASRMERYVDALTCADGHVLHHGDNDDGKIVSLLHLEDGWLPRVTVPAVETSRAFEDSGQIVLRSAAIVASFDAGSVGLGALAAHAHCDSLALNIALNGQPLFVERGTFRYNGDAAARERYRCTAAHNTIQLGDEEHATPAGPFLWHEKPAVVIERCELAPERDLVVAAMKGLRRTILRVGDCLAVVDTGPGAITTRWHVAPKLRVERSGNTFAIGKAWCWTQQDARVVEWAHSSMYASEETAQTIEIRGTNRIATVIGTGGPTQIKSLLEAAAGLDR